MESFIGFERRLFGATPTPSSLLSLVGCSHFSRLLSSQIHPFFDSITKRPYSDAFVIVSAVLTVIAFMISWTWWVGLLFSLGGMVMFQMLWCSRQTSGALYSFAAVAMVCALIEIFVGLWFSLGFRNYTICSALNMKGVGDNTDPDARDYCPEELFAGFSFVCGGLWFLVSSFMLCFLKSGRHARFEEKHSCTTATANAVVEMQVIDVGADDDFVPIVVPAEVLAPDP